MTMLERARAATWQRILENGSYGVITRQPTVDNGLGGRAPDGDPIAFNIFCRVAMESMTDWRFAPNAEQGQKSGLAPFLLAMWNVDIAEGDRLHWRGKDYRIFSVSRASRFGGAVNTQAILSEVTK
jgi:hypothetical protein